MRHEYNALQEAFASINKVYPNAVLMGDLALLYQGYDIRPNKSILEVYIPDEFDKSKISGIIYSTEFISSKAYVYDEKYLCESYRGYYQYYIPDDPYPVEMIFYLHILKPGEEVNCMPEWVNCFCGKCATVTEVLQQKLRTAHLKKGAVANICTADLLSFFMWNSDYKWKSFDSLVNNIIRPVTKEANEEGEIILGYWLDRPIVFFDTKTTGTDTTNDRIVEISITKIYSSKGFEIYTQKINPTIPIPEEASKVHGIFDDDVKNMPTFKDVADKISHMLDECDVAGFDIISIDMPILVEEFLRAGEHLPFDESTKVIDAQRIFHDREKRDLSAAYSFYCGKELEGAHSADADTFATIEVLIAQIQRYGLSKDVSELHELCKWGDEFVDYGRKFEKTKNGKIVFTCGKHQNEIVSYWHLDYLRWMLEQDFSNHTKLIIKQLINDIIKEGPDV